MIGLQRDSIRIRENDRKAFLSLAEKFEHTQPRHGQGTVHDRPKAATTKAKPVPIEAGTMSGPPAPMARTMNTTSIPSSITILKDVPKVTLSMAPPLVAPAAEQLGLLGEGLRLIVQCVALSFVSAVSAVSRPPAGHVVRVRPADPPERGYPVA